MKYCYPDFARFLFFFLTLLCSPDLLRAQSETEPNDAFATANPMAFATAMSGGLCAPDNEDYFRVVLPAGNKSIRLITSASMVGATQTGAVYVYLYNKYQGQLSNRFLSLTGTTLTDTLDFDCFEGDTFYVRVLNWTGPCKQYTIRCESTNNFSLPNDTEPNDNFTAAQGLIFQKDTTGHLASQRYINGASGDNEDFYRCILPAGTKSIRLYTATRMISPGSTGAVYFYLYNKYQQELINHYVPLTSAFLNDTIHYDCFEGDTFYVRVLNWTGPCKEYRIRAEHTNNFSLKNDTEPNDNFTTAQDLLFQKDTTGHLASQRYLGTAAMDNEDYYRCILPPGGTKSLRLITSSRTVSPGATGAVYYYLYNKFQQQLTNRYLSLSNTLLTDTLDFNCFEGDTFYVRVLNWTGSCKEYRLRMDYTNQYTLQNDQEPNDNFNTALGLVFQKDTTGHLASQRYLATASDDNEDYYICVLPPGGTRSLRLTTSARTISPGTTGAVYYYFYNKYRQQLTNRYVSFGNSAVLDTMDYTCFEGDTFYVRVLNWTGPCKEYRIRADYTNEFSLQNDIEPNDDFASAGHLDFQRDTTGHLNAQRYLSGPSSDNEDYYRCVLPSGGKSLRLIASTRMVQPGSTGGVYYYLYNKYQQQLANMYVSPTSAVRTDTLDYSCFEGDTFYVRVLNWTGPCKEYRIRTDYTNEFTLANDVEPNESIIAATPIEFGAHVTGHLASQVYEATAPRNDQNDWYRCILPDNGKGIRIVSTMRMVQPGATGALYYYIYNRSGNTVAQRYVPLTSTATADTLEFNCILPDTFYIRIYNWTGPCKEYSFHTMKSATGPISFDISHTRFGNDFSFMNTTRNAQTFRWNFGDGQTDTVAAPTHSYGIGRFLVTLNASNICGPRTFRDTIEVNGVEYYTPRSAGTDNGLGIFTVRIFGGGLDSSLTFTLKGTSGTYKAERMRSPRSTEATGSFNFKNVPPGDYDVEIRLPGGQIYNYPKGFQVYVDTPGFNITTEIFAPGRVRTGRMNWYALKVHNHKGRIANGVRAFIVTTRGMQTTIRDVIYRRSGKLKIKGSDYDALTIDREAYSKLYYQGNFDPDRDTIEIDRDKIYSVFDSLISFDIDSLYGEPFRGTVYPISIPYIKANGQHTIHFQAATPANGDFRLVSYVMPWTVRQNPISGETLDYIHEGGMQAAALAEYAPNPALRAVGKSAGYVDIGSQVAFTEFFDWYYGTNVADDAFYARQGIALAGEVSEELVPFGNKADAAIDQARNAKRQIARHTEHLNFDQDLILSGIKDPNLAKHMSDRLEFLKDGIAKHGANLSRAEKEAALNQMKDWAAKQGINLTTKQIEDLVMPKDMSRKKVESLNSFDPNAIYGPDGPGPQHYIRRSAGMNYEVTFENVDTALAPAQIVRVHVALDTSKFDLRETWLNSIRLGGRLYTFEDDRKEYFRDIDLRPARNMIVRVNARTDTVSGKLYWEFLSLDPVTKNLISDVDDGFLPPNKVSPEGEGAVSFSTRLKPTVANRDSVSAFATIYFDENEPILTNTWVNQVDEGKPVSVLDPSVRVDGDSLMTLTLSGTDAESGFREYRLYVKKGDSSWSDKPYPINTATGTVLIGQPGETYSFYVEGRDSVGIWESKPRKAEATVSLNRNGPAVPANAIAVYPNPAKDIINVRLNAAAGGDLHIRLTNITGQRVAAFEARHAAGTTDYSISTGSLESGIYFVEVQVNDESFDPVKLVILQ